MDPMELMSTWEENLLGSNETSDDLICAVGSAQDPPTPLPYSRAVILAIKIYSIIIFYSTFIAGSFLNILLLYLIIRYKKLHTLTFGISLQIVAIDLCQLFGVCAFRLVTVVTEEWLFGAGMCIFTGLGFLLVSLARPFLMCVFVIDRFLSVFAAYLYPRHSKKIILILCVASWFATLSFLLPTFPGLLDCYSYSALHNQCAFDGSCNQACLLYARLFVGLVFAPTTVVSVVLYTVLYCKAKKAKKTNNVVVPTGCEDQKKRDWKAAITFFLLFLAAFILTTPASLVTVIVSAILQSEGPSPALYIVLSVSVSVPSLIVVADPIVIMRHSDVKEVLREIKTKLCGRCGSKVHGDE